MIGGGAVGRHDACPAAVTRGTERIPGARLDVVDQGQPASSAWVPAPAIDRTDGLRSASGLRIPGMRKAHWRSASRHVM
jgi:hypothetical protein